MITISINIPLEIISVEKGYWEILFNSNHRILQDFVLTDSYSPGVIVDPVQIYDVDNNTLLVEGTDYEISHGTIDNLSARTFTVEFLNQTDDVQYSLNYSTSYHASEDRVNARNNYTITFEGGETSSFAEVPRPVLNIQKSSTTVDGVTVHADGSISLAVITWQIDGIQIVLTMFT